MERCIVGIYLAICSLTDIKRKEIPLLFTVCAAVQGIVCQCILRRLPWSVWAGGIFLGICLAGISRITREAIGYGDALCVTAVGACLGAIENIRLLLWALALSAVFSAVLLGFGKADSKYRLPFAPFLFASHIGIALFDWSGRI